MSERSHLRPLTRPASAAVEPIRLFVLDVAIALLNFIGRVKF